MLNTAVAVANDGRPAQASGEPKPWFPPPPRKPLKDGESWEDHAMRQDHSGGTSDVVRLAVAKTIRKVHVRVREAPAVPAPPLPSLPGTAADPETANGGRLPLLPPIPKQFVRDVATSTGGDGRTTNNPGPALKSAMKKSRSGVDRSKSRRKTILEHFEGWWDLGIIDSHRQTLIARGAPPLNA